MKTTAALFTGALVLTIATSQVPASAAQRCAVRSRDAKVMMAVPPEYPESAQSQGSAVALVDIGILPNGKVSSARIMQSTGNMAMDASALRAARMSTYRPKIVNCRPVRGRYLFRALFSPR